ncbi:uncharacterized protein ARMOST_04483 [Armillaria ostoyae]|uniref:Elongin-C n=1 Tax=Armillaria ostoyae TaxID=47428 RepID=A0A284QXM3_ARMOS|nr:uncharacterized protein ARMOST_04483 [Armillaria ostoyae]
MADVEMNADSKDEDWVRIESNDGFSFLVRRRVANISGTIKNSLDTESGFSEAESKTYVAREYRGLIVQKLLEYMCFKAHYEKVGPKEEVPVNEFLERIPPEIVLELLLAADYQESQYPSFSPRNESAKRVRSVKQIAVCVFDLCTIYRIRVTFNGMCSWSCLSSISQNAATSKDDYTRYDTGLSHHVVAIPGPLATTASPSHRQ